MILPSRNDLLLPPGSGLLHIGPHKTGTTTLQSAFHHNRDILEGHGIHYAGRRKQPMDTALAVAIELFANANDAAAPPDRR